VKLTLIFTDEPHLKGLSKYDIYQTHFEFPGEALQLPDCEARLLSIVETVGQLTHATLHVTCKEIGWKQKLIKVGQVPENHKEKLQNTNNVIGIVFKRFDLSRGRSFINPVKIFAPIHHPFPLHTVQIKGNPSIGNQQWLMDDRKINSTNADYFELINRIRDALLPLLKTEESKYKSLQWAYLGFHPQWYEDSLRKRRNKQRKPVYFGEEKLRREALEQARQAKKSGQTQKGRVYFIQQGDEGAIKIGYSTTPEKRLQTLKTASPYPLRLLKVIEGGKILEKELHLRFAALHIDGEWFNPNPELLEFIQQLEAFKNE
jgi:hypothetical protein